MSITIEFTIGYLYALAFLVGYGFTSVICDLNNTDNPTLKRGAIRALGIVSVCVLVDTIRLFC